MKRVGSYSGLLFLSFVLFPASFAAAPELLSPLPSSSPLDAYGSSILPMPSTWESGYFLLSTFFLNPGVPAVKTTDSTIPYFTPLGTLPVPFSFSFVIATVISCPISPAAYVCVDTAVDV